MGKEIIYKELSMDILDNISNILKMKINLSFDNNFIIRCNQEFLKDFLELAGSVKWFIEPKKGFKYNDNFYEFEVIEIYNEFIYSYAEIIVNSEFILKIKKDVNADRNEINRFIALQNQGLTTFIKKEKTLYDLLNNKQQKIVNRFIKNIILEE